MTHISSPDHATPLACKGKHDFAAEWRQRSKVLVRGNNVVSILVVLTGLCKLQLKQTNSLLHLFLSSALEKSNQILKPKIRSCLLQDFANAKLSAEALATAINSNPASVFKTLIAQKVHGKAYNVAIAGPSAGTAAVANAPIGDLSSSIALLSGSQGPFQNAT